MGTGRDPMFGPFGALWREEQRKKEEAAGQAPPHDPAAGPGCCCHDCERAEEADNHTWD